MTRSLSFPHDSSRGLRIGVVLFQLGGPDSLDAVEPFLYNLFSDPDIIDFPFARLARSTLARLVARSRAHKVRSRYAQIGGRSPIIELTLRQASALEQELQKTLPARVFVAMRYWHPLTDEVVAEIQRSRFDRLVLLPLYPQYSRVTTGSSLNEWHRRYRAAARDHVPVHTIGHYYDHPLYLEALAQNINQALARFPAGETVHLVFSAHSVPASVIEGGDAYQQHVEETVRLAMQRGGWPHPHWLCYQSKVGPGRWLEPMLHTTLKSLRAAGARSLLVVPIAFVTDHIETSYEIDIEAREQADALGFIQFEIMPALNDSPLFIGALADLVGQAIAPKDEAPLLTRVCRDTIK